MISNNQIKKILIFVPSIEDGGVEKNLFLISNYFYQNGINVNIISANRDKKKYFNNQHGRNNIRYSLIKTKIAWLVIKGMLDY